MDNNNDESKIYVLDDNNLPKEYDLLFSFECEELNKTYVAYNSEKYDEAGNNIIMIASCDPDNKYTRLEPVTDPDELAMANEVLKEVLESQGE